MRKNVIFWFLTILVVIMYFIGSMFGSSILEWIPIPAPDPDVIARVEMIKSFTEMVAIVIAGLWAYELYIKGLGNPFPKIQHKVQHFKLSNGMIYLSVIITVINEGKIKLDLGKGKIIVRQVSPVTGKINELIQNSLSEAGLNSIIEGKVPMLFKDLGQRVGWVTLGSRDWKEQLRDELKKLEPGQTRETQFDFLIVKDDEEIEVIQIISYFNFGRSHWELATLHSLVESDTDKE